MKRIIVTVSLLLLITLCNTMNVSANTINENQEIDTKSVLKLLEKLDKFDEKNKDVKINEKSIQFVDEELMKLGVEEYVLEGLQFEQKRVMLKQALEEGGAYSGAEVQKFNQSTGKSEKYNPNAIKLFSYSSLPEEDLTITVTTWDVYDSNGDIETIRVSFWYNWEIMPWNRYEDPIAIGWNNENFSLVEGSFKAVDYYQYNGIETKAYIKSTKTQPTNPSNYGMEWQADLSSQPDPGFWSEGSKDRLYGYGTFKLEPDPFYSFREGEVIKFFYRYVHTFTNASYSFSYGVAGIGFSGDNCSMIGGSKTTYLNNSSYSELKTMKVKIDRPHDIDGVYRITDSGRFNQNYDIVRFDRDYNINLDTMKELGFKYISMNITLNMKESNDGYQGVLIFSEVTESNTYLLGWSGDLECGGPGVQSSYVDMSFSVNNIDINSFDASDNRFIVRYGAHGKDHDTWYNRNLRIELVFSKTPL